MDNSDSKHILVKRQFGDGTFGSISSISTQIFEDDNLDGSEYKGNHRADQRQRDGAHQRGYHHAVGSGHIVRGIAVGKHGAVAGNGHGGQQHADAREHRIHRQELDRQQLQRGHDEHAQKAYAVHALVGQRLSDIAVGHGSADNHHTKRRRKITQITYNCFNKSRCFNLEQGNCY